MATCYCECGAKYQVAEASLGKKAKCQRCGAAFTLKESEDGTIAIAESIDVGNFETEETAVVLLERGFEVEKQRIKEFLSDL
ncbi:MAG: hypothetical protein IIB90_18755 [Gemmatimonadetes bacterium]|nr:hypothetical protein [Gemmatimonadota bacterium]